MVLVPSKIEAKVAQVKSLLRHENSAVTKRGAKAHSAGTTLPAQIAGDDEGKQCERRESQHCQPYIVSEALLKPANLHKSASGQILLKRKEPCLGRHCSTAQPESYPNPLLYPLQTTLPAWYQVPTCLEPIWYGEEGTQISLLSTPGHPVKTQNEDSPHIFTVSRCSTAPHLA